MFTLNTEVKRHCSGLLGEMLDESPIVVIQGARQVGKSTLARQVTERCDAWSVSLDDTDVAALARSDPRGFVGQAPGRLLVLDEAQREPTLTLALKMAVDRNRRPGQFLITGSADFLRLKTTGDSLAGRAEILTLRPLSMGELQQRRTPRTGSPGFWPERRAGSRPNPRKPLVNALSVEVTPWPCRVAPRLRDNAGSTDICNP